MIHDGKRLMNDDNDDNDDNGVDRCDRGAWELPCFGMTNALVIR